MHASGSFQHLRSLRVNDNPVQHEPHFYFSLQRLMPWTQHEFGHATDFPDDLQIRLIQQEAVLTSPEALQTVMQGQWGIRAAPHHQVALSPLPVPDCSTLARGDRRTAPAIVRPGVGWLADGGQERSAADSGGAAHQGLVMLKGAARRLRHAQVCDRQHMLHASAAQACSNTDTYRRQPRHVRCMTTSNMAVVAAQHHRVIIQA